MNTAEAKDCSPDQLASRGDLGRSPEVPGKGTQRLPARDRITSIHFRNYKAFSDFRVSLDDFNILVGPNNAGKSTVLGALRILAEAVKKASTRNPEWLPSGRGGTYGYRVELGNLPVSTENVFHNYDESEPARVTFGLSNGNALKLVFPERGSCQMFIDSTKAVRSAAAFRSSFNLKIAFVPVLGPVEHNERLYQREAARLALLSAAAARNFRNIWHHFPENFDEFRELVKATWPGMDIQRPELMAIGDEPVLMMFCPEERYPREIYWAGFGFQVWCQMLTFVIQARDASLLVIDEPDIYLHSDLQRQLVTLLEDLKCPVVMATHSTEIISEVEASRILNVDKRFRSARRVANTKELQNVFGILGSRLNPALTQIAKTRRVVFVEGKDFQVLSRLARRLGFPQVATRSPFAVVPVEGVEPRKVRDFSAGMEATIGCQLLKTAILDRGFRSSAEMRAIKADLESFCKLAVVHRGHEVENLLLVQSVLHRAILAELEKAGKGQMTEGDLVSLIVEITDSMKSTLNAQYLERHVGYEQSSNPGFNPVASRTAAAAEFDAAWAALERRLEIVPGKPFLSALNEKLQAGFGVCISPLDLVDVARGNEIKGETRDLISGLDLFCRAHPPE
jgi:energy-coupling factor transporter ATP-binding protein EcfA2